MQLTSRKKSFPALGSLGILAGILLIAWGVVRSGGGDPVLPWIHIVTGICLLVAWIGNVMSQVVRIVVDDEVIQYHRRKSRSLVIDRASIIDSEVRPNRIRFRYKGPLDVQSASIPLRLFGKRDAERLRDIFTGDKEARQPGRGDGEKACDPSGDKPAS